MNMKSSMEKSQESTEKLRKQAGLYLLFQILYRALESLLSGKGFFLKLLTPAGFCGIFPF